MATRLDAPQPSAAQTPVVDLTTGGGRLNGNRAKAKAQRQQSAAPQTGRPAWVSAALALLAGALALVGGWLLLQSDGDSAAPVPTIAVLHAVVDLPAGTEVDVILDEADSLLEQKAIPFEFVLPGAMTSTIELESLRGQRLTSPIYAGNPLATTGFRPVNDFEGESFIDRQSGIEAPAGHMRVALRLPPSRALGGSIAAGDTVAVLATFKATERTATVTTLLLPAIEVVDVKGDRGLEASEDDDSLDPATSIDGIAVSEFDITVAVTPQEATMLAYAVEGGSIMLAVAVEGAEYDDARYADTLGTLFGDIELYEATEQIELDALPTIEEPDADADEATDGADGATGDSAGQTDAEASPGGITAIPPSGVTPDELTEEG